MTVLPAEQRGSMASTTVLPPVPSAATVSGGWSWPSMLSTTPNDPAGPRQEREGRLHQNLRLRPRDEDAVVDYKLAAVKLRPAADVLQRLAVKAARETRFHLRGDGVRKSARHGRKITRQRKHLPAPRLDLPRLLQ